MNILLVAADKFPPFRSDIAVLFGKKMVERGHRVDWILQSEETLRRSCRTSWRGSDVLVGRTDNGTSKFSKLRKNLYRILHELKMFRQLQSGQFDHLIVKDIFVSAVAAPLASAIFGVRLIYWLSFPFPEFYLHLAEKDLAPYPWFYRLRGHALKLLLYRFILPSAEHIFVQTAQMREDIAGHGIPRQKMTPVLMGVAVEDIPFWGYGAENGNGKENTIVYLGTLGKERRLDFLLRAFRKVLDSGKNANLRLVGGGETEAETAERIIKEEAGKLNISDKVHITGFQPQKTAWSHVRDAAVCVSPIPPGPILDCGSPTKLIEYMAMGKAAVANDHPEQRAVIEESGAGLCVPYDEDAFARAILYLLEHRGEAKAMGIRGRKYVESKRNYDILADLVERRLLGLQPARES
ncbi:MAG: glycosyltransferase family 4 protein [Syntrophobacteraceae bacterium]|nr:glycosyltransferase family 4 protein [Desulfobacteraceae bacterium]